MIVVPLTDVVENLQEQVSPAISYSKTHIIMFIQFFLQSWPVC